jgi:hypothetical protein
VIAPFFGGSQCVRRLLTQPFPRSSAHNRPNQERMHGAVEGSMRLYHEYTCENMYRVNTTSISPSRSANGAPPCRTPHARDAAGAARNLGAIHPGPLCHQPFRSRRLPAAPRNADVRRAYPRRIACRPGVPPADHGPWCKTTGSRPDTRAGRW